MVAQEDKVVRLEPDVTVRAGRARPSHRWLKVVLMIGVPALAAAACLALYMNGGRYEVTEDARIRAGRVNISANVAGRVAQILVQDNQRVSQGQVLFRLDSAPYDAAVRSAAAELAAARLQVAVARSAYAPRAAELGAAKSELEYQERELERIRVLAERGIAPRRDMDVRANEVAAARGKVGVAEAAMREAVTAAGVGLKGSVESHPAVRQAEAALERAMLDRTYTEVRAPISGVVTRVEQLQVGSTIVAAQPLYSLVTDKVWIEANFRENQLAHLRTGQPGLAMLDARPGEKLAVKVGSLSPGAASVFAVLPPENASGNFVKVTQRLPVRVEFQQPVDPMLYRSGLSARVRIDTGHRRTWSDLLTPFRAWIW
jgi:membrane fusion protein (multidrug efflux system)